MSEMRASVPTTVDFDENPACSPLEALSLSFSSVATSVGPEASQVASPRLIVTCRAALQENEEDDATPYDSRSCTSDSDLEEEEEELDEEALAARAEVLRRYQLVHGPSRANLMHDRQRLAAVRQNALNNFILRNSKLTVVSRQDHHIMLRQLIGEAFHRDADRRAHRTQWRRIVAAVRKEYWGANAIFTLSPDPYHTVLAKLSSMTLWGEEVGQWQYAYCEDVLTQRRARQAQVLEELQRAGKLFL